MISQHHFPGIYIQLRIISVYIKDIWKTYDNMIRDWERAPYEALKLVNREMGIKFFISKESCDINNEIAILIIIVVLLQ